MTGATSMTGTTEWQQRFDRRILRQGRGFEHVLQHLAQNAVGFRVFAH